MPPRYLQVKLTDGKDAVLVIRPDEEDIQGDLVSWFRHLDPLRVFETTDGSAVLRGDAARAVRELTDPDERMSTPWLKHTHRRLVAVLAVIAGLLPPGAAVLDIVANLTGLRRPLVVEIVCPKNVAVPGGPQTEEAKRRLEEERRRYAPYFEPGWAPGLPGTDYVAVANTGSWGQIQGPQLYANVVPVASIVGDRLVPLPGKEGWEGWSREHTPTTLNTVVGGTTLPVGGTAFSVGDPLRVEDPTAWAETPLVAWQLPRREAKLALYAFNSFAQAEPDNALACLGMAVAQEHLGKRADAEKAYERAVEAVPSLRTRVEALKMNPYSSTAREIVYGAQRALQ